MTSRSDHDLPFRGSGGGTGGAVTSVDGRTGDVLLTDRYILQTKQGVANGVATTGADGLLTASQVPPGMQGPPGNTGPTGPAGTAATATAGTTATGAPGTNATVVNSGTTSAAIFDFTIPRGATGSQGPQGNPGTPGGTGAQGPAGPGVAAGGTTGQILSKNSATDFDTHWIAAPTGGGIPTGGTVGQTLTKNSATDFDAGWATPPVSWPLAVAQPLSSTQWTSATAFASGSAPTTFAYTISVPDASAFALNRPATVTNLGHYISAAGSSTMNLVLAIYDSDPVTLYPRTQLWTTTFAANLATGTKDVPITPSLVLPVGLYWIVACSQGSGSVTGGSIFNNYDSPYVRCLGGNTHVPGGRYTFAAIASGGLPATMPAPTGTSIEGRRYHLKGS